MVSKLNRSIEKMYQKSQKEIDQIFDSAEEAPPVVQTSTVSVIKSRASIFSKIFKSIKEFYDSHTVDFKYLLLIIPIVATFLFAREVQKRQSLKTSAAIHQASVYFQLTSWSLPPESSFDIWINPDSPVGFANVELSFDPNLIKLTGEISTYPSLGRTIKVSSMAEANSTGKVSIVLALDPSQISTPPSDAFRIAAIKLNTNTTSPLTTQVGFNNSGMQMVAIDQSVFTTTTEGLSLSLNSTPQPTPTGPPIVAPLIITNIQAANITQNSATIGWDLSDYGTGQVEYGATTSYGSFTTPETSFNWNHHAQNISNLNPNTVYHYRVISSNKAGQETKSADHTFQTLTSLYPTPAQSSTPLPTPYPTPSATPTPLFQVSGVVTNAVDSSPIQGVTVKIRSDNAKWWQRSATAQTDRYGHYAAYLAEGDYKATVSKQKFVTVTRTLLLRTNTIMNFQLSPR